MAARSVLAATAALTAALLLAALWPVPAFELALAPAVSLTVLARDGSLLREFAARDGEGHAAPAHLDELPAHVWQAFLAAEDARLFSHPGVDPIAVGRALYQDLRRRRLAQGASTMAMQLSRLLRPHPRTLPGKLSEALFALRLTHALGRRGVLEQYLTRVPLGNDVRGVEAAARLYFDKPARALSPAQAALLAALPRSPTALDPLRAPGRAEAAARRVLRQMEARGFIASAAAFAEAPLDLSQERLRRAFEAAHFVEEVARAHSPAGATVVKTTLDLALQRKVEEAVQDQLAALEDRRVGSAAVLVLDNASSEVLAWVGSPDWFDEEHQGRIDGVRTRRQPGSALKPFAYAQAIERHGLTAATLLSDVESHFSGQSGDYMPRNYDRRAHGPVRARVALASSYNVPAVRVAEKVSAPELLRTLRRLGFDSLDQTADHYGLGLVLGDGEVSLLELGRAYTALARGGVLRSLRLVREADDAAGRPLPLARAASRRVFSAPTAALIADILQDAAARAPAFGLDNALRFPFPAAAKTGTSRAFTDNWTVGFTRERTVAVWVGNMSGETMRHVSGITGAGPLFQRALLLAMEGVEPAPLYDAVFDERELCALSGELAGDACPARVTEKFIPGTAPRGACAMHRGGPVDLGPRFYDWAAHEGVHSATSAAAGGAQAALIFPEDGDEFLRGADLPDAFQTIPVRALAPRGGALELQVDQGPRSALPAPLQHAHPGGARQAHAAALPARSQRARRDRVLRGRGLN